MQRIKIPNKPFSLTFLTTEKEISADTYFLIERMIALRNETKIQNCINKLAHFIDKDMKHEAIEQLSSLNLSLYYSKSDIVLEFGVLACLESTKKASSIEEAIEKGKSLRGLDLPLEEVLSITSEVKKKLMSS